MYTSSQAFITLLTLSQLQGSFGRRYNPYRQQHEEIDGSIKQTIPRPQVLNFTVTEQCPAPTSTRPSVLSTVVPSPGAAPIEITTQSEVVTSYLPEMTWCVGPPIGLIPIATVSGPPYLNVSTKYSTTTAGTGSCETVYTPTTTTVCATTLTGLASKITVTHCDQEITFSSECGFTIETPTPTNGNLSMLMITPAPTVKKVMTYYLAPWQSLTLGETPSDVDMKICTELEGDQLECIRYQEVWEVLVVTSTITTQRAVQLATTVTGPGTLLVETMQVYVTDTVETVDLSTVLLLETEIETESTSRGTKLVTRPEDGEVLPTSTVHTTQEVHYKSPAPEPTTITTVRETSVVTLYSTITRTRARPHRV
ncbi:hypothetical protein BDV95DRAFT_558775 [Massariosphaeria phaeospora]|uniref:Uncharacterized protein n=1 Tax=Massariosphaeria phaeospora TaxID=100035 RepID=A0A7C8II93_9PLEO|nr:hypothetical protein BDV95DRAFT_558775 [Massariosphaeria phaeospora]